MFMNSLMILSSTKNNREKRIMHVATTAFGSGQAAGAFVPETNYGRQFS